MSTGDYQEQQYQLPLCRGPEALRYSAERLQNDAALLIAHACAGGYEALQGEHGMCVYLR